MQSTILMLSHKEEYVAQIALFQNYQICMLHFVHKMGKAKESCVFTFKTFFKLHLYLVF